MPAPPPAPSPTPAGLTVTPTRADLTGSPGALLYPPSVRVTDADGRPAAGVEVRWTLDRTSAGPGTDGALFPDRTTTDDTGLAQTLWIPGTKAVQRLRAGVTGAADALLTAQMNPTSALGQWAEADFTALASNGQRVTIRPLAVGRPASIGGHAGASLFDFGLHFTGTPGQATLRLSLSPLVGQPGVLEAGTADRCGLTPDGAYRCEESVSWRPGEAFVFELETRSVPDAPGATDLTLFVTRDGVDRAPLAVLRLPTSPSLQGGGVIINPEGEWSEHCLAVPAVSALFGPLEVRSGRGWQAVRRVSVRNDQAPNACGNVQYAVQDGFLRMGTGGTEIGDPRLSTLTLP